VVVPAAAALEVRAVVAAAAAARAAVRPIPSTKAQHRNHSTMTSRSDHRFLVLAV
jgi:hypothetical protein